MKIALFGQNLNLNYLNSVETILESAKKNNCELYIYKNFLEFLSNHIKIDPKINIFESYNDIKGNIDYLISLGGDGTLLKAITLVRDSNIPIFGVNTGRLGFLSSITKEEIKDCFEKLINKNYSIETRTLLRLESDTQMFGSENFALNDFTIQKEASGSMIKIDVEINNEFLNSYWADGLIVSTPTGSTAYSLSCGGPILMPYTNNFIITPISPHNLNVRPLVVSDNDIFTFKAETRNECLIATLDNRTIKIKSPFNFKIIKENFKINLIKINNISFLKTLQTKLMWGYDNRNI